MAQESVAEPHAQPWNATQAIILVLVKELRNRNRERDLFEWICYHHNPRLVVAQDGDFVGAYVATYGWRLSFVICKA